MSSATLKLSPPEIRCDDITRSHVLQSSASPLVAACIFLVTSCHLVEEPAFRSESNIVLVPTLVKGRSDGLVYALMTKDFIVEDQRLARMIASLRDLKT